MNEYIGKLCFESQFAQELTGFIREKQGLGGQTGHTARTYLQMRNYRNFLMQPVKWNALKKGGKFSICFFHCSYVRGCGLGKR